MTGPRREADEQLRARLREAGGAHRPDRSRILARVERGMAARVRGPARPRLPGWVRVAGATAAVAGVLVAGGYTVASTAPEAPPAQRPAAASPGSREPGPLWSSGAVDPHSNEFWAQSNITLGTTTPLTALTVELRVAQTGSVTSTGAWRSLPEGDFTFTLDERDGFLVYRWALRPGRTVPAGEWVFAGQYNHERGGRDAGGDRYSATATAASGTRTVRGGFTPGG
ncbi:Anti-sigma factor OS=Streptomyces tendae OX=1932 GN=GUR47_13185 PE=4 SV=1 [Streptomyces tendae]